MLDGLFSTGFLAFIWAYEVTIKKLTFHLHWASLIEEFFAVVLMSLHENKSIKKTNTVDPRFSEYDF